LPAAIAQAALAKATGLGTKVTSRRGKKYHRRRRIFKNCGKVDGNVIDVR